MPHGLPCCRKQGKFKEMHEALLAWEPSGSGKKQKPMREKDIDKLAKGLDLDVKQLKEDMHDKAFNKELKDVKRLAQVVGLRGTPYFIFADKSGKHIINVPGGLSDDDFQRTIDMLLDKAVDKKVDGDDEAAADDAKADDSEAKDAKPQEDK